MAENSLILEHSSLIHDGGPLYHEFICDATIKEPWNAYSSLIFFIPVAFWIWKLRGVYRQNLIIVFILPFLFFNGLGSTLFHAFRSNSAFLYLDFLPAQIMSFILSAYLWTRLVKKWYYGGIIVLLFYALASISVQYLSQIDGMELMAPNIAYFFVGASFFIPVLIIMLKTRFYKLKYVVLTFTFLILALLCRVSDYPTPNPFPEMLPQGTHFMWHVFSAIAVFTMGYYVYFINRIRIERGTVLRNR